MLSAQLAMYPVRHCGETEMAKRAPQDLNRVEGRECIMEMQVTDRAMQSL